jgi:transcriptional regulator with XRE-family HTH domain
MFWENFVALCDKNGTKPNPVAKELGISSGSVTFWKKGKVPHHSTLIKIANYFGVSVDYLLTGQKEKPTDNGELSVKKKQIIERIKFMPDEKLVRVEQILDIVESTDS